MGLGSFKALGGVYGVASILSDIYKINLSTLDISDLPLLRAKDTIFVCASAGNHGLSVAAGAGLFGARSRIYLGSGVPDDFANRLTAMGSEVVRVDGDYEHSVRCAISDAKDTGAIHLADGSWSGYIESPRLIMEGYTAMAVELSHQFSALGEWPTHVFLQAGVGGLAASMAYAIHKLWDTLPRLIVVEPTQAACLSKSVEANELLTVSGDVSNMGRLDCKTPSLLAFEVLRVLADSFVEVSDEQACDAVAYASTLGYSTTPSGAAGLAAMRCECDGTTRPLIILSEGTME